MIHEALRIHPSTGIILERCVPRGGIKIHGTYLAENTIIGVNCWVINRNKDIFGEDVESFRPERWIESAPKAVQKMRLNLFTVRRHLLSLRQLIVIFALPKNTLLTETFGYFLVWRGLTILYWKKSCHDANL